MFNHRCNITPLLLLGHGIHPKSRIPLLNQLSQPTRHGFLHGLLTRETPHKLRRSHRDFIATIHLPEMVRLAINRRDISHLRRFRRLPYLVRDPARCRHNQHPGLYLKLVRVPQLSFFGWERLEKARGYHVFDPDQSGVFLGGVVD